MRPLPLNRVLVGDARTQLKRLPASSIHSCVTSPPYWNLRNHFHPNQIGLEQQVDDWVNKLVGVFDEVARVMRPDGTLWLNVADSYVRKTSQGTPKSLAMGPEKLVMALTERNWRLRNRIAWTKPNPTPSSAKDRLTAAWEFVFVLCRSDQYFFDLDSIRIASTSRRPRSKEPSAAVVRHQRPAWSGPLAGDQTGLARLKLSGRTAHVLGKNPTDHWHFATSNHRNTNHAAFPERLVERPIAAGTPELACASCGRGWRRLPPEIIGVDEVTLGAVVPSCDCRAGAIKGIVLDPFMGSGTTADVAERLGRSWIGCEINPEYAELTVRRVQAARERMAA